MVSNVKKYIKSRLMNEQNSFMCYLPQKNNKSCAVLLLKKKENKRKVNR